MGSNVSMSAYMTSDPTTSLATVREGRPEMDFSAAPSLFLEEDVRQEEMLLHHRRTTLINLQRAEQDEAVAVGVRKNAEKKAEEKIAIEREQAAKAAESREVEVRAVEQRAAIEAAYSEAELQARAAIARAPELREMLQSARKAQDDCMIARSQDAEAAEFAATEARNAEREAVEARRMQDCAYSERKSLEAKAYRAPMIGSLLDGRGPYLLD